MDDRVLDATQQKDWRIKRRWKKAESPANERDVEKRMKKS